MAFVYLDQPTTAPATMPGPKFTYLDPPTTPQPQSATPTQPQGKSVGGFLGNLVSSGENFAGNIGHALAHPVTTAENVASIPIGLGEKLGRVTDNTLTSNKNHPVMAQETFLNKLLAQYKQRYGGGKNIANTLYKDPIGAATDLAGALSGAGEAVSAAGKVADIGALGKAGELVGTVGNAVDPLQAAGKVVGGATKAIGKGTGNVAAAAFGNTTGVGSTAIKEAYAGGDAVNQGMRGGLNQTDILNHAKDALGNIVQNRQEQYLTNFEKATGHANPGIAVDPIRSQFSDLLKKFNINQTKTGLDFTHATVDPAEQGKITQIDQKLQRFEQNPNEVTVRNVDAFKRQLSDMYSPSSSIRAFTTQLKNGVSTELNKVPGYAEATQGYAGHSQLLDQIKKGLSVGTKAGEQTAINKLLGAVKNDKQLSLDLIDELSKSSPIDLKGALSGSLLHNLAPQGLIGKLLGGGEVAMGAHSLAAIPHLLPGLATTSPRLVGEAAQATGKVARTVGKGGAKLAPLTKQAAVNALIQGTNR